MTSNEYHLKDRGQRIMLRSIAMICATLVTLTIAVFSFISEEPYFAGVMIFTIVGYIVLIEKLIRMPGVIYTQTEEETNDDDDQGSDDSSLTGSGGSSLTA
jgi:F0F1-type ATP synthase assembly protein I